MADFKSRYFARKLVLFFFFFLQVGCAASYLDDDGKRHIVGFVHVEIAPENEQSQVAGNSVEVSNIGLLLSIHEEQKHLSIGYVSEKTIYLKNNVLIGSPELYKENVTESKSTKEN